MPDKSNHIFNQIQQLHLDPPAGAFEKAWQAITQTELNIGRNIEEEERKIFSQLQDFVMTAPAMDFNTIKGTEAKTRTMVMPAYWMRAAAVLLVLATSSILYFTVFRNKQASEQNFAGPGLQNNTTPQITGNNSAGDTSTKGLAVITADGTTDTNFPGDVRLNKIIRNHNLVAGKKRMGAVKITGTEAELYENDVLLTLVNYKSPDWERFFTKTVTEKRITLNKYSYHNLSDKMVALLQDTYLTKDNGKPSRKAKKALKKFEKWRKQDEYYFDKDLQKNATDIIDFSEFILNK